MFRVVYKDGGTNVEHEEACVQVTEGGVNLQDVEQFRLNGVARIKFGGSSGERETGVLDVVREWE